MCVCKYKIYAIYKIIITCFDIPSNLLITRDTLSLLFHVDNSLPRDAE